MEDWLDDVEFPATKEDVIAAADDANAPQETIERLQQLSQEQYESREQLEAELEALDQ